MKHQRRRSTLGDPNYVSTVPAYVVPLSDKYFGSGGIAVVLTAGEEVTPLIRAAAATLDFENEDEALTELVRRAVIKESRRILDHA